MLGFTVLFAILSTIVSASPLPMPATRHNDDLAAREEPSAMARRGHTGPWRFTHWYDDNTPCWVDGQRGWIRDQTCGDLISVDAKVAVGKGGLLGLGGDKPYRYDRYGDYYADGIPCYRNSNEGVLKDTLCVALDLTSGGHDGYYPSKFNRYYADKTPCWVDSRRGWVHDGYCGDLVDVDADIKIGKRFYREDPFYVDDVPCWSHDREGRMKDYTCTALDVDVDAKVNVKRHSHDAYYNGHGWYPESIPTKGTPCSKDGRAGIVDNAICVVGDIHIGKRLFSDGQYRHGPIEGDKCKHNGRWGVFQNALCVLVDVHVKRDLLGGLVDTITGHDHGDHFDRYGRYHKFGHGHDEDVVDVDADVVVGGVDNGHRRILAKKGLLDLGHIGDRYDYKHGYKYGYPHADGELVDIDADVKVGDDRGRQHGHGLVLRELGNGLGGLTGDKGAVGGVVKGLKSMSAGNGGDLAGVTKGLGGLGLGRRGDSRMQDRDVHGLIGQNKYHHDDGIVAEVAAAIAVDKHTTYNKGLLNHVVRQKSESEEQVQQGEHQAEDDEEHYKY